MAQQHRVRRDLGDRAEHLDVQLTLNQGALAISTDGATWEWPVSTVDADFWDGAEFELDFDGETVIFYSEDPLGFLFDFLPVLRSRRSRRPISLRSWRRRLRPELALVRPPSDGHGRPAVEADAAEPEPALQSDDPWTDVALGRAYSDVMDVLQQLYGADRDQDELEDRPSDPEGCSECHRVFIDLTDQVGDPR